MEDTKNKMSKHQIQKLISKTAVISVALIVIIALISVFMGLLYLLPILLYIEIAVVIIDIVSWFLLRITFPKPKITTQIQHETKSAVKCFICLGYIKFGLPVITCNCGRTFHEVCRKRVAECPYCKMRW